MPLLVCISSLRSWRRTRTERGSARRPILASNFESSSKNHLKKKKSTCISTISLFARMMQKFEKRTATTFRTLSYPQRSSLLPTSFENEALAGTRACCWSCCIACIAHGVHIQRQEETVGISWCETQVFRFSAWAQVHRLFESGRISEVLATLPATGIPSQYAGTILEEVGRRSRALRSDGRPKLGR